MAPGKGRVRADKVFGAWREPLVGEVPQGERYRVALWARRKARERIVGDG